MTYASTTLIVSNLSTIYGHQSNKELNQISTHYAKYKYNENDHSSEQVGIATLLENPYDININRNRSHNNNTRALDLSSDLKLNLLEKNNKNHIAKRSVRKRETNINTNEWKGSSKRKYSINIESDQNITMKNIEIASSVNNFSQTRMAHRDNLNGSSKNGVTSIRQKPDKNTTNNMHVIEKFKIENVTQNRKSIKYKIFNENNIYSGMQIRASAFTQQQDSQQFETDNTYATRQSSSTMELECIPGYDGGLPQRFVLEAYDSISRKLRLNVTSIYTDLPLFRFDISGKLICKTKNFDSC